MRGISGGKGANKSERSRNTLSVSKKIKAFVASIISTDGDAASYLSTSLLAANLSGKSVETANTVLPCASV